MISSRLSVSDYRKLAKPKKRAKYGNVRKVLDGIKFHSKGEAKRWAELKLLERAGQISNLERQVKMPLAAWGNPITIGHFVVDFRYIEHGVYCYEDWKGYIPDLSAWKLKHFRAQYGDIRVTGAAQRRKAA